MKKTTLIILSLLLPVITFATNITIDALTGKWEFIHWADLSTPEKKHKLGYIMDFQANGNVITQMKKEDIIEHYEVTNNTIIYKSKYGKQIWKLVSFDPDKGFVVSHMSTVMTFEKR